MKFFSTYVIRNATNKIIIHKWDRSIDQYNLVSFRGQYIWSKNVAWVGLF